MDENTVKIFADEYRYLLRRNKKLTLLENAGVENWDWYDEALIGYDYDDE